MAALCLVLANKAYSSWSMRPWLLMRVLGIGFDEVVLPLDQPGTAAAIAAVTPSGKLPVLLDGRAGERLTIWDSFAIIEHLAESYPAVWPAEPRARVLARSLAAEMHAGFPALRRALPMNARRAPAPLALADEAAVQADIDRIEAAFDDARRRFGQSGPFLFGAFCAADAIYAPVASRLLAYARPVRPATRAFIEALAALPAWRDWHAGAQAEGWRIERFERGADPSDA